MNITVKFFLKRPKSGRLTSIEMRMQLDKQQFKYSTGQSIHLELWDKSTQRPTKKRTIISKWNKKAPQTGVHLQNIHTRLEKIANHITTYINVERQKDDTRKISKVELKTHLDIKLGKVKAQTVSNLLIDYTNQFIEEIKSGKRLTNKKTRYKLGTIKNYLGFKVQLLEYQDSRNKQICFEDIDMKFYDDFIAFFQAKNYKLNAIGRHIKHIKSILRFSYQDGRHTNKIFEDKRFKTLEKEVETIYLNETEITALHQLDLSEQPKLERARDLFLIGCYSSLRYSDYSQLQPNNFEEKDGKVYIKVFAEKTNIKTIVPVNTPLKYILNKYDFTVPPSFEQHVNRDIKVVAKMAGINALTEIQEHRGGKLQSVTKPKYNLITTHTGRRSSATNMLNQGIDTYSIRQITGHKSEKSFNRYLRRSKEENAIGLAAHDYFS